MKRAVYGILMAGLIASVATPAHAAMAKVAGLYVCDMPMPPATVPDAAQPMAGMPSTLPLRLQQNGKGFFWGGVPNMASVRGQAKADGTMSFRVKFLMGEPGMHGAEEVPGTITQNAGNLVFSPVDKQKEKHTLTCKLSDDKGYQASVQTLQSFLKTLHGMVDMREIARCTNVLGELQRAQGEYFSHYKTYASTRRQLRSMKGFDKLALKDVGNVCRSWAMRRRKGGGFEVWGQPKTTYAKGCSLTLPILNEKTEEPVFSASCPSMGAEKKP